MKRCVASVLFVFAAIAATTLSQLPAQAQDKDAWAPLLFLMGNWSGVGSGQPGEALSGSTTFSFDLGKTVIVRKNKAEYPPKPGEKIGLTHEDLMIIYQQPGEAGFKAIYFDNEGHVIRYRITIPAKQPAAVFDSEGGEKGPRFQLICEAVPNGALSVEFLMAPPGSDLKSYVKGTIKKNG